MDRDRITLQLRGVHNGGIEFDAFIEELNAVKNALIATDRLVSHGQSVYFAVGLQADAGASVVIQAVPLGNAGQDNAVAVMDRFVLVWSRLAHGQGLPDFDYAAWQSFKQMADVLITDQLDEVVISRNGDRVSVSPDVVRFLEQITPRDDAAAGLSEAGPAEDGLPALADLWGIAPDALGGKASDDFIADLRGEW